MGLTRREGAEEGEPEKYYPSGVRTYGRMTPPDHLQAAAATAYMRDLGVDSVFIVDDAEVYGRGMADMVASESESAGISVAGRAVWESGG